MKVLLVVWLLGQMGPTQPVAIREYRGDTAMQTCESVLNDWTHVSQKHQGMCLKIFPRHD